MNIKIVVLIAAKKDFLIGIKNNISRFLLNLL
jgi:hypothetical protein